MSVRTIIESDLSGQPDAVTQVISCADLRFEVDLTGDEHDELMALLAPYVRVGRPVRPKPRREVKPSTRAERQEMRDWAKKNGYSLSDYGRVPARVRAAYHEAQEKARQQV